jgi:hypothetical protein
LDDLDDEDDQECLLNYKQNEVNRGASLSSLAKPIRSDADKSNGDESTDSNDASKQFEHHLITIKESQDKGLADMETGSEVYMSELLVSHT